MSLQCDSNYLANLLFSPTAGYRWYLDNSIFNKIIVGFIICTVWGKINYNSNVYFYIYTDTLKLIDELTTIINNFT